MNVAFYAPLKPPDHPNPSGDRRMARSICSALRAAGCDVVLASRLRSWEGTGDLDRQRRLQMVASALGRRLVRRWGNGRAAWRPEAWLTYHLYHKAPDWLGPVVSDALGIPYIVIEASSASSQQGGPWDLGYRAAVAAIRQADALLVPNRNDLQALRRLLGDSERIRYLPPFVDLAPYLGRDRTRLRSQLARKWGLDRNTPWLFCVAMMREGDKLASYRQLAVALGTVIDLPWQLVVIGDGEARSAVSAVLEAALGRRCTMVGQADGALVADGLVAADLLVWPAVNEAYGMALLEAQAAGVAVVAGRVGGVPDLIVDGVTGILVESGDTISFGAAVRGLLNDPSRRRQMGRNARRKTASDHGITAAGGVLLEVIQRTAMERMR